MRIDDLNERLHLKIPENGNYATVAGFLLSRFGRVPVLGETLDLGLARYTVLAATSKNVQHVGIHLTMGSGSGAMNDRTIQQTN